MVEVLYFQSLVWTSVPFYPFGSILSAILMIFNFKWYQFALQRLFAQPTMAISARETYDSVVITLHYLSNVGGLMEINEMLLLG
jgi:hypothetical protein